MPRKAKAKKAKPKRRKAPPASPRRSAEPVEWYPIRFREIFKKKIWGGPELAKALRKRCPAKTGESWEVSQYGRDVSVVANGPLKGMSLTRLLEDHRRAVLGDEHYMRFHEKFPLIVKFLCAHDRLSLQVHPSDDYAQRYEVEGVGKVEAWYVVHSEKTGRVIRGVLPGTTVAEFRQHLAAGTVEQCLNVMEVSRGDVIFIPPGTVHTAYGGVVFLEVQQSSDVTYRLSDWDRRDFSGRERKLDVEKAIGVTDFYSMGVSKFKPSRIPGYSYRRKLLIKCEKFTMESMEIRGKRVKDAGHRDRFRILTVVSGNGKFHHGGKKKTKSTPFKPGETFLIPAYLGPYDISSRGTAEIVCTYVE